MSDTDQVNLDHSTPSPSGTGDGAGFARDQLLVTLGLLAFMAGILLAKSAFMLGAVTVPRTSQVLQVAIDQLGGDLPQVTCFAITGPMPFAALLLASVAAVLRCSPSPSPVGPCCVRRSC